MSYDRRSWHPLVDASNAVAVRTAANRRPPVGATFHKAKDLLLASDHRRADDFGGEFHELELQIDPYYKPK